MRTGTGVFGAVILLAGGTMASADVSINRITYHGWKSAYRLSNKTVELVFVPQIGRIMRYGFIGGANLLWESRALDGKTTDLKNPPKSWENYGGDKCWPAPQSRWGWPPDPVMDSGSQVAKILPDKHLMVLGQANKTLGVRFVREIALDPTGTGVTIQNTLINTGPKPDTWAVWEIAQTDDPNLIRLPLHKAGHFPNGFTVLADAQPASVPENVRVVEEELHITRSPMQSSKVGSDSPLGWIVAEKTGLKFEVSFTPEADKPYPDNGCTLEVYTSNDPMKYVELELLGPMTPIAPNTQITLTTHWKLTK